MTLYKIVYELETALGDKVVHAFIGTQKQIIEAIKTAHACEYKIIKVERMPE